MRTRILSTVLAMVCGAAAAFVQGMVSPATVVAHGGGLDSRGCHNDRQRGGYHCHQGPLAGQSFGSAADAIAAMNKQARRPSPTPSPAPALAAVAPTIATPTAERSVDFHEAPNGAYQRFTADEIAAQGMTFERLSQPPMTVGRRQWVQVRLHTRSGPGRTGYVEATSPALGPPLTMVGPSSAVTAVAATPAPSPAGFCGLDRRMFELLVSLRMQTSESTSDSWSPHATQWNNEIASNIAAGRNTPALDATYERYSRYCAEGDSFMAGIVIGEWVGIGLRAP